MMMMMMMVVVVMMMMTTTTMMDEMMMVELMITMMMTGYKMDGWGQRMNEMVLMKPRCVVVLIRKSLRDLI